MDCHHPESSGEKPDTIVYFCPRCDWRTQPASPMNAGVGLPACGNCGGRLRYVSYHAATESTLAERVIREESLEKFGSGICIACRKPRGAGSIMGSAERGWWIHVDCAIQQ